MAPRVLPAEMASSPERRERFRRDARAVAALNHPHLVTIHSVEEQGGVHFLTMERVDGEPLDRLIPPGGLPADRILEVASALAEALTAAHDKGIVHRDLKPANVMLTKEGRVQILDVGLAKVKGPRDEAQFNSQLETEMRTRDRMVMGRGSKAESFEKLLHLFRIGHNPRAARRDGGSAQSPPRPARAETRLRQRRPGRA